jgi:hypothetical protein
MAANLRRAGYELTVFNRTRERARAFAAAHGGTVADTPADVGAASDVVITMVVEGAQVTRAAGPFRPRRTREVLTAAIARRLGGADFAARGGSGDHPPLSGRNPPFVESSIPLAAFGAENAQIPHPALLPAGTCQ